jgi:hypothetical protein
MKHAKPRYSEALIKAACRDGDPAAIAELATRIASEWKAREAARKEGKGGLYRALGYIPESLAANFVYRMVKAYNPSLPVELVEALQLVLKQDRVPPEGHDLRYDEAEAILQEEPGIKERELAERVRLPRSSIAEWRKRRQL